jgi:hypothetical protein
MLRLLTFLTLVAGCSAHHPGATLPVPAPETGRVVLIAREAPTLDGVRPIAVALTNGTERTLRLESRQIYVGSEGARVAPLAPGEAARRAGGHDAPGMVRRAAVGAATGSVLGAAGGAISGAIQGGVGLATAAGSAVGAFFGALGGLLSGHDAAPDVAGFEDRALHDDLLAPGFSTSGYVYYPAGSYPSLEALLTDEQGQVERLVTSIEPAP